MEGEEEGINTRHTLGRVGEKWEGLKPGVSRMVFSEMTVWCLRGKNGTGMLGVWSSGVGAGVGI